VNLREKFADLVEREIVLQNNGQEGHLIFKMNSLVTRHL